MIIQRHQIIAAVDGAAREILLSYDNETIQDADWTQICRDIADLAAKMLGFAEPERKP